jgi:hypothetical protein
MPWECNEPARGIASGPQDIVRSTGRRDQAGLRPGSARGRPANIAGPGCAREPDIEALSNRLLSRGSVPVPTQWAGRSWRPKKAKADAKAPTCLLSGESAPGYARPWWGRFGLTWCEI